MEDQKTDKHDTSQPKTIQELEKNYSERIVSACQKKLKKLRASEKRYGEMIVTINAEQERTKIKKAAFLQLWEKSSGVVSYVCDKLGIARETFYQWKMNDLEFAAKIRVVENRRLDAAEDILFGKVYIERDASCVKYLLDRKHPNYKPKSVTEVVAGERTLEDLLAEDDAKIKKAQEEYDRKHNDNGHKATGQEERRPNEPIQDQDKAGGDGQVHSEPGSSVLPETTNA